MGTCMPYGMRHGMDRLNEKNFSSIPAGKLPSTRVLPKQPGARNIAHSTNQLFTNPWQVLLHVARITSSQQIIHEGGANTQLRACYARIEEWNLTGTSKQFSGMSCTFHYNPKPKEYLPTMPRHRHHATLPAHRIPVMESKLLTPAYTEFTWRKAKSYF